MQQPQNPFQSPIGRKPVGHGNRELFQVAGNEHTGFPLRADPKMVPIHKGTDKFPE